MCLASTEGLGGVVCQRLQHIRTPLCNRNLGYLDELISAPTVPLLHGAVDRLSVLERVVAFGIAHVDRLPRRQDEDLGAVLVIALFYSSHIALVPLTFGVWLLVLLLIGNKMGIRSTAFYLIIGFAVWIAFLLSGVHATIAGVLGQ